MLFGTNVAKQHTNDTNPAARLSAALASHTAQELMMFSKGLFPLVLLGWMVPMVAWAMPQYPKVELEAMPSIELKSPVLGGVLVTDLNKDKKADVIVNQFTKGLVLMRHKEGKFAEVASFAAVTGRGTPSAADIDRDGKIEVLVGGLRYNQTTQQNEFGVFVLNAALEQVSFWKLPGEVSGGIVLRDLDGDKKLDIITSTSNGFLVALKPNGEMHSGFPVKVEHTLDKSEVIKLPTPSVGEFDGDTSNGPEIILATTGGVLHAFFRDGKKLPSYPIKLDAPSFASTLIGDFDGDGKGEILAVTSKGTVERRLPDGSSADGFPVKLNKYTTSTPVVVDLDKDGKREVYIATQDGKVYGLGLDGKVLSGWPRSVLTPVSADLLVGDVDGDADMELLVATQGGAIFAFEKKGLYVYGYPKKVAVSIYATPALADVTATGKAHWVVPCQSRKVNLLRDPRPLVRNLQEGQPWLGQQGGAMRHGSLDNVTLKAALIVTKTPTATKEPTPTQQQPPATGGDDKPQSSSGCQVGQGADVPGGMSWLAAMMILLLWGGRRRKA